MSNSSLIDKVIPAYEGNYTKGRIKKIQKITIHHMYMVTDIETCGRVFQRVGRKGSSNYGIGLDGRIGLYVNEADTPWTDSNWDSNCMSVTIENSNSSLEAPYPVSDATLNSLIKLVADIAKRNDLGNLVVGQNLTWHRMYANTSCPGDYLIGKMQYICDEANKINNEEPTPTDLKIEKIDRKSIVLNKNASLWNLDFKNWDDAKSVKDYEKGTIIEDIVAIATHPLGGKYYMTEYSYNNNKHNGFNTVDCDDAVVTYIVKQGDTLTKIAEENNTTVDEIVTDNNLIHVGQELIINK